MSRKFLVTIYKAFLRPLIDYGDIIYDQPQNESFCEELESAQYKTTLAITGVIQGISLERSIRISTRITQIKEMVQTSKLHA